MNFMSTIAINQASAAKSAGQAGLKRRPRNQPAGITERIAHRKNCQLYCVWVRVLKQLCSFLIRRLSSEAAERQELQLLIWK